MARDTLVDVFAEFAGKRGAFLAYDDGYRWRSRTYEDVARAARGFAARLSEAGVVSGDKVIFWCENRPEWIAAYWGCLIAGVIVVPVDYRSNPRFVTTVLRLVGAKSVLLGDDVPASAPDLDLGTAFRWTLARLDWEADGPMPRREIHRDDIIQIIFTSGATAEPKGVLIRHRNILANTVPVEREIAKYSRYLRLVRPLRFLNLLPLSHLFGQSLATGIPPMVNGTAIFASSLNPHDIVALLRARHVSVLVAVPKMLEVMREHIGHAYPEANAPPPPGTSIPGRWWRYRRVHRALGLKFWAFVVGAAPLAPELEAFWRRMGFAVIQGYGLTETAPIVTLNHPFHTSLGSVGTPIGGVEIKLADDGEIFVRGENVTSGYYGQAESLFDEDGWLHTGDIGARDADGRLFIKGRKKEMIVTPEGLNVFPDDVEHVLDAVPGVQESAVVGVGDGREERVHAVLVLDDDVDPDTVIRAANQTLADHQRVRTVSVWPQGPLPRTEGTRKLKRAAVRDWVQSGMSTQAPAPVGTSLEDLVARYARGRAIGEDTTIEDLGLSSLERVELMVALEDRFQTRVDEARFASAASVSDIRALLTAPPQLDAAEVPVEFPSWNRRWPVRVLRRLSQATWILPLARAFAWTRVEGRQHLESLDGPVIFAANHLSHLDVPVILAAMPGRIRARVAPAMAKEFFRAHFYPESTTRREWLTNTVNYLLAACFFNAFPLPQREAGARHTLQYIGELANQRWSVLIFPEGERSHTGLIKPFRGGIGIIAARLDVPVVPVRLDGVDRVLPVGRSTARPGHVRVAFGAPMRLRGQDYAALAADVETAVRRL